MKIIRGDYMGSKASLRYSFFGGPVLRIRSCPPKRYHIPKEISKLILIKKEQTRSLGQLMIILVIGITIIGLPLSILLFFMMKKVIFSIYVKTTTGEKFFLEEGNNSEWKIIKNFIGMNKEFLVS